MNNLTKLTKLIIGCWLNSLMVFAVVAQATEHSDKPLLKSCNKLAVFELRQCLAETDFRQNDHCWSESHLAYRDCVLGLAVDNQAHHSHQAQSKKQIKQKRQLDKQLKPQNIRAHLLGAANRSVYAAVLARTIKAIDQRLGLIDSGKNSEKKLKAKLIARRDAFSRFSLWLEQDLSCEQLKSKITQGLKQLPSSSNDDIELKQAFRELNQYAASYCGIVS